MKAIFKAVKNIAKMLSTLFDFIVDLIQDLIYVVELLADGLKELPMMFSWLPGALVTAIITIFGIVVIYKILGREG